MDVFSELYSTWNSTYQDVYDFIEAIINKRITDDDSLRDEQFVIISPLLSFLDGKALFFSQELSVQCGAALMFPDNYSEAECRKYLKHIQEQNKIVTKMIRDESGLTMLNKNIKGIIKYKHKSDVISYFKKINRKIK